MTLQQKVESEINIMQEEKLQILIQFAEFLNSSDHACFPTRKGQEIDRSGMYGMLKGEIWMADDFNETPEEFKEYM